MRESELKLFIGMEIKAACLHEAYQCIAMLIPWHDALNFEKENSLLFQLILTWCLKFWEIKFLTFSTNFDTCMYVCMYVLYVWSTPRMGMTEKIPGCNVRNIFSIKWFWIYTWICCWSDFKHLHMNHWSVKVKDQEFWHCQLCCWHFYARGVWGLIPGHALFDQKYFVWISFYLLMLSIQRKLFDICQFCCCHLYARGGCCG